MTGPRRLRRLARARLPHVRRGRLGGPWRIAVADGSMRPAIEPGDWLLVDPTVARWPRRGTVVVFREPGSDRLAIKRVAARHGDWVPFADAWLQLGDDEAWLIGDATDIDLEASGSGAAVDSRRYGPVPVGALIARAWFRYWPGRRIGPLAPPPPDLLDRGRGGHIPKPGGPEVPAESSRTASGPAATEPATLD